MERIINKVSFGKKNKLISISYSENDNNKLLESNKAFSNSFTGAMNTIKAQIALYLGLNGFIENLRSLCSNYLDEV